MKHLDASAILATKAALKTEEVAAFGGTVIVRELDGLGRDQFEGSQFTFRKEGKEFVAEPNLKDRRALLAVLCCVDADGNRLFADSQVAEVSGLSGRDLTKIAEVARRLSGLDEVEVEAAKGE